MDKRAVYFLLLAALAAGIAAQTAAAQCKLTETEVQGEPAIVLENSFVQLRVRPTLGGRIDQLIYKPTGKWLTAQTGGTVLTDRVWNYADRDVYQQWTSAVYGYELHPGDDTAAVTLSCRGSAGIGTRLTFNKTIRLTADSAAVRADYALELGSEAMTPHRAGIWWHNQLGVPQEATTYYVPTPQGVQSVVYSGSSLGQYWWYDSPRGWAAALGKSGTGVAAVMDDRKLMCFYHSLQGEVAMMEWAYRSEEIPNGGAAQTTLWLVPFAGLDMVGGAGMDVVGEIAAPEQVTVDQASAGVPLSVKFAAPRAWDAKVKLTWRRLPDGEVHEVESWAAKLSPQAVAEKQVQVKLPEAGTYVLRAEVLSEQGLAADVLAHTVVGEPSAEVAIAPLRERLGREGERFEDKIAARSGAGYVPPSEEIVTPHVEWAKPYVAGRLKTLILNDLLTGRETIELAQRFDMHYTAPTISSPYAGKRHIDAAMDHVRERLNDDLDVIIVGGINASIFPEDVVSGILDKVKGGTGLVWVNPNKCSETLWSALTFTGDPVGSSPSRKWQAVSGHYLTEGIPWEELPPTPTCQYKATGEVLVRADKLPVLAVQELGKGRIVCLGYATSWQGPGFYSNGITPWIQFAPTKFAYWEYYFNLLAKCMVWAAHKEPAVQFTSLAAGKDPYVLGTDEQPTVKLGVRNSGGAAELVGRVTINDQYGHLVRKFDKVFVAEPGDGELEILLPELYGGMHLVDIIVEDAAGAKVNWATVPIHVTPPVQVAALQVADRIYRGGDSLDAEIELTAGETAPANAKLRTMLTDAHGRLVSDQQQEVATTGKSTVSIRLPEPLATTAVLRVELHGQTGLLDAAEQKVLMMPTAWDRREWGPFRSGIWGNPADAYSREYLQPWTSERVRTAGIDCVTTSASWLIDGEQRSAFEAGFQSLPMGVGADVLSAKAEPDKGLLEFAKAKEEYVRTHDKKYLQRPWCLNAQDTRQRLTTQAEKVCSAVAKYRPLGYVCGDELSYTYYTTPFDYDFGPVALAEFRKWLQTQYPTLSALNAEWDTDFATWDEVMPMTTEEVRERSNYAPWADHRTFNEITFAEFLRFVDGALESYDPGARLGTSGTQAAAPYGGFDWWRLTDAFDFVQAYDHQNTGEMHRAFHDMLAAPWWGYGATDPGLAHQLWRRLLNGNAGAMCFSLGGMLRPDYTYSRTFAEGTAHLKEMQGGLARLLHESDSRTTDVYMHYSQPSIHGVYITGGEAIFGADRDGWIRAIEDSGLQMKFLSYAQLEDGELTKLMPRVFVLPYSVAISDAEATALRKYVEAGGVLIADARCGLMDQHCVPRSEGVLDSLFGIERTAVDPSAKRAPAEASFSTALGQCDPRGITFDDMSGETMIRVTTGTALGQMADAPALIVRNVGKGKAVLLNLFMDSYPRRRGLGLEGPLRQLVNEVFDLAGVKPFAEVVPNDASHFYVVRYHSGKADYVAVLREPSTVLTGGGPGSAKAGEVTERAYTKVHFPHNAYLYDLRAGKYLGEADTTAKLMPQGYCQVYSLLPYQVTGVKVTPRAKSKQAGTTMAYRVAVEAKGGKPGLHVLRVEVVGPDGIKDYYGTQMTATEGAGEAEFDLALNDQPGAWQIKATDIASGVSGSAQFTVTRADAGQ